MDAQSKGDGDFLPSLKQLKNDLDTSSDNEDDELDSSSDMKKTGRQDSGEHRGNQQQTLRKRDVKGNYKAKFNIEKLMIEHEKKKILLDDLNQKREEFLEQLNDLRNSIGKKVQSGDQLDPNSKQAQVSKCHWDFLQKEMKWMAEDFERETKKKLGDSKKQSRMCKKQLHEKKLKKEKDLKDQKVEVRKKAVQMSRMVTQFWKSVEKVVKHNYNVLYEKKRQQIRTKKLENFVSKHLKLSVKVAEELNTKSFIEQSMHTKDADSSLLGKRTSEEPQTQLKIYYSQDEQGHQEQVENLNKDQQAEVGPYKRQKQTVNVVVHKGKDGLYQIDEEFEKNQAMHSQILSQNQQQQPDESFSVTKIAEQTVEMAKSFQPTGTTLSSVQVKTKVPFLLQGSLREYQIIGLDWLVTLHNKKLNGILADEMGLGKTIQTISMLASLACDRGVWGPHLIVVPTTIIINWEMEFKKWCPAFKILTYFGSQKERKMKRHGWSKDNSFHVCITSYKLVIQDHFAFRRKKWYYMILDEAQNIKNFKSQRWQTLLRFNTKRRLLLTGTPLQNDVMELWSLMHFLMPNIFSSQQDFKEWFSNPFNQSITQNQSLNISVVQKLQSILRPFLLRRMKRDVEKQLPEKVEHIVQCNLSRRQRLLYDEYINSDKTRNTLNDGADFFSIMNVLMQLRKVCNHPDLFEARTIESPFIMQERMRFNLPSLIYKAFMHDPLEDIDFKGIDCVLAEHESMSRAEHQRMLELYPRRPLVQVVGEFKGSIDQMGEYLMSTRPVADGYAIGKRLPVNCNVLAKPNTKSLLQTLPTVLPQESNIYHDIPSYLNTACLPFAQHYYSLPEFDHIRYSERSKRYCEYDTYMSALRDEEQRLHLIKFAQKLIQWRQIDQTNRTNLHFKKPVFGEDLRRCVRITLLFSADLFDVSKRGHKNLDRFSKHSPLSSSDLYSSPSAVFNQFAQTQQIVYEPDAELKWRNVNIGDWPEESEDQIEVLYRCPSKLIKEVPLSQQLKNKKRKQQLKQQMLEQQQEQQRLMEEQAKQALKEAEERERQRVEDERLRMEQLEREKYIVRKISLVIDMAGVKAQKEGEDELEENPHVKVEIEEVQLPREEEVGEDVNMDESLKKSTKQENEGQSEIKDGDQEMENAESAYEKPCDNENQDQNSRQSTLPGGQNPNQNSQDPLLTEPTPIKEQDFKSPEILEQSLPQDQQKPQNVEPQKVKQDLGNTITYKNCDVLRDLVITPLQRVSVLEEVIKHYKFIIPKAVARTADFVPTKVITKHEKEKAYERYAYQKLMSHRNVNQSLKFSNILFFPHKNLIQYDCGKLQRLAQLLKNLQAKGHKVLIFTQMTRILDILENFLNLHGYSYVRLDGSVKVEMRQRLVDKFNLNKKIFCFISSTRCGGIGINLTGADCVIFYDTDWNPAMDKQAQDRCHRIGQTKTVHIYRLISVNTIEENIFKKSLQKRDFGGLIIEGGFDMELFKKVSLKDILEDADTIFRPKRRDLMKEENIVFHTNTSVIGTADDHQGEVPVELDFEKQKEIEQYRRRFEEALVRIEDKEDVIALQQAKREIDDEFVDEDGAVTGQGTTTANESTAQAAQPDQQIEEEVAPGKDQAAELDSKSAQQLSRDLKKSEFINWRTHSTLNEVTKMAIEYYETNYQFDTYLDDRAKKDTKFVNPLKDEEEKEANEPKEKEKKDDDSEFSFSDEDEEMSQNAPEMDHWDRAIADQLYKRTREEIESKYFTM